MEEATRKIIQDFESNRTNENLIKNRRTLLLQRQKRRRDEIEKLDFQIRKQARERSFIQKHHFSSEPRGTQSFSPHYVHMASLLKSLVALIRQRNDIAADQDRDQIDLEDLSNWKSSMSFL